MKELKMSLGIILGVILVAALLGLGCVFAVAAAYLWLRIVGLIIAIAVTAVIVFLTVVVVMSNAIGSNK